MAATAHADYSVVWRAQTGPQTALISCPVFEVFFGGARGGGKTDGVLGDFIRHASLYGKHAIGLMIRRQRTERVVVVVGLSHGMGSFRVCFETPRLENCKIQTTSPRPSASSQMEMAGKNLKKTMNINTKPDMDATIMEISVRLGV